MEFIQTLRLPLVYCLVHVLIVGCSPADMPQQAELAPAATSNTKATVQRSSESKNLARLAWPNWMGPRHDVVDARQVVARHVEQQVMLEMIVDVVRRDEQPLQHVGAGCPGVAQGIIAVGHGSVLGDVADAGDDHHPGQHRHQPEQRIGPPHPRQRQPREQDAIDEELRAERLTERLQAPGQWP